MIIAVPDDQTPFSVLSCYSAFSLASFFFFFHFLRTSSPRRNSSRGDKSFSGTNYSCFPLWTDETNTQPPTLLIKSWVSCLLAAALFLIQQFDLETALCNMAAIIKAAWLQKMHANRLGAGIQLSLELPYPASAYASFKRVNVQLKSRTQFFSNTEENKLHLIINNNNLYPIIPQKKSLLKHQIWFTVSSALQTKHIEFTPKQKKVWTPFQLIPY